MVVARRARRHAVARSTTCPRRHRSGSAAMAAQVPARVAARARRAGLIKRTPEPEGPDKPINGQPIALGQFLEFNPHSGDGGAFSSTNPNHSADRFDSFLTTGEVEMHFL